VFDLRDVYQEHNPGVKQDLPVLVTMLEFRPPKSLDIHKLILNMDDPFKYR